MKVEAFELGDNLNKHNVRFTLFPANWDLFDFDAIDLSLSNWVEIKYLNNDGSSMSDKVEQIPNSKGGIYIFMIKNKILPGSSEYLAYIGRALLTENQNLRKRCKEYFQKFSKSHERPLITRLFSLWKDCIFLKYIEIDDNTIIEELESKLINSVLPPFNFTIPDKNIRQAVRAFNL